MYSHLGNKAPSSSFNLGGFNPGRVTVQVRTDYGERVRKGVKHGSSAYETEEEESDPHSHEDFSLNSILEERSCHYCPHL